MTDPEGKQDHGRDIDLNRGRNFYGPLSGEVRARLMRLLRDPSEANWDDAQGIILTGVCGMTLWQAVIEVDPSFATVRGPVYELAGGKSRRVSGWARVPTAEVIRQAIRWAVA